MRDLYDTPELHRVFIQKCLDKFGFLASYGCELTNVEEDRYGVEVTYKNQTTGIKVSFESRENDISVYLIRLIHGDVPAYIDAPSHWFYLDNVVKFRSPSTMLPRKEPRDLFTPDDIDYFLTINADVLKEYGEEILHGDFSIFAELAKQINRPKSSSDSQEFQIITSNEELVTQKKKLPAQIVEYYDTYFSELRNQLQKPDLFSEAVPEFLKGYKRVISIGVRDGVVVAHFPIELKITLSEAKEGDVLMQFPSVPNAKEDSYEFIQFPGSLASDVATFISEGEDIGAELPSEEAFWGVRTFSAPQQKIDPATGELAWEAPWTRLVCADLYHLRFWKNTEQASREAREDVDPYINELESRAKTSTTNTGQNETNTLENFSESREISTSLDGSSADFGQAFDEVPERSRLDESMSFSAA